VQQERLELCQQAGYEISGERSGGALRLGSLEKTTEIVIQRG
jgi:hypothetical protein